VPIAPPAAHEAALYWRLMVVDRPGTLQQVVAELARRDISLAAVDQRPAGEGMARLVLVTHRTRVGRLGEAVSRLQDHPAVAAVGRPIPVWGEMV
jgi:homoserine dehydrogenase